MTLRWLYGSRIRFGTCCQLIHSRDRDHSQRRQRLGLSQHHLIRNQRPHRRQHRHDRSDVELNERRNLPIVMSCEQSSMQSLMMRFQTSTIAAGVERIIKRRRISRMRYSVVANWCQSLRCDVRRHDWDARFGIYC